MPTYPFLKSKSLSKADFFFFWIDWGRVELLTCFHCCLFPYWENWPSLNVLVTSVTGPKVREDLTLWVVWRTGIEGKSSKVRPVSVTTVSLSVVAQDRNQCRISPIGHRLQRKISGVLTIGYPKQKECFGFRNSIL